MTLKSKRQWVGLVRMKRIPQEVWRPLSGGRRRARRRRRRRTACSAGSGSSGSQLEVRPDSDWSKSESSERIATCEEVAGPKEELWSEEKKHVHVLLKQQKGNNFIQWFKIK